MRLTYRKTANADGSVTVETPSVLRRLWRGVRWALALCFLAAFAGALIGADWATAGWALLITALFLPKVKR